MNLLFSLAYRYTKNQKRHTILTSVGVVLSVILMVTAFASVNTVMATRKNIIAYKNGSYHVLFNDVSKDDLLTISNMDIFERSCKYGITVYTDSVFSDPESVGLSDVSYLSDENGQVVNVSFLRIEDTRSDMLPVDIIALDEGRLPAERGEITLSLTDSERFGDPAVGSKIRFLVTNCVKKDSLGDAKITDSEYDGIPISDLLTDNYDISSAKTVEYTVVGKSKNNTMIAYSDSNLMSYTKQLDKLLLCYTDEANDYYWDMHHAFRDKNLEIDDFDYSFNQEYLNMINKGVTAKSYNTIFYALVYLGILFLMFCVRMVIDNSFEISSHERIRQFGVLRAAGASKKQILGILISEALILAVIGVPLGILCGYGLSSLAFSGIKNLDSMRYLSEDYDLPSMMEFSITPLSIISSFVIGVFWIIISAVGTGLRVNKLSPIQAIRAAEKRTKVGKPERKATVEKMGVERLVAFRSIRRNNKRFIITVLSIAMSVTAYVILSYAVETVRNRISEVYSESAAPYDYVITFSSGFHGASEETERQIIETGLFKNVQYDAFIQYIAETDSDTNEKDSALGYYYIKLHPINSGTYKYLTGKDDFDEFENSGKIILNDTMHGKTEYSMFRAVPEKISVVAFVNYMTFDTEEIGVYGTFSTENSIYRSEDSFVEACIAESNYSRYVEKYSGDSSVQVYGLMDGVATRYSTSAFVRQIYADPVDEAARSDAEMWLDRRFYDSYTDNYKSEKMLRAYVSAGQLFGYSAIALITLIASVNIINIISTNVLNRTAEIGMLRACGMSAKQLVRMIFSESFIYAGFSSLCAALAVEGAILVIMIPFLIGQTFTMDDLPVTLSFIAPLKYILIGAAAAFILSFAAALPAIMRIIRIPVVEAVETME